MIFTIILGGLLIETVVLGIVVMRSLQKAEKSDLKANKNETETNLSWPNPMKDVFDEYGKDSNEYKIAVKCYEYGYESRNIDISNHFSKFLPHMEAVLDVKTGPECEGYKDAIKHIKGFMEAELSLYG